MINVIIADDHEIIRRGLKQILGGESDISVVAEASSSEDLMDKLKKIRCHVVLLDISLPGRSGIDALKDIKKLYPQVGVLMLSMYSEKVYALRAIRDGAAGYLTKETASDELILAIKKVSAGEKYITPRVAEQLASAIETGGTSNLHENLSDREFEIFKLLAAGKTVSHIARELFLSVKTVNAHRQNILQKLHLKTTAEMVRYAIEHKLLD